MIPATGLNEVMDAALSSGTCELCLEEKVLRSSHLIPAGVLKTLRNPSISNADPILLTNKVALQTSRPIKERMLCGDCEDLFSKKGETWVIANIARGDSFPLHDALIDAKPLLETSEFAVYAGSEIANIKCDKLIYFGMSLFWRSAAHRWKTVGGADHQIALGPYQEPIRQFLRDEGNFPRNTVLSLRAWPVKTFCGVIPPIAAAGIGTHHEFVFYVPGIEFRLCTGQRIPDKIRKMCFHSSTGQPFAVLKIPIATGWTRSLGGAWDTAHFSEKLTRALAIRERVTE
jgi:hypothetical protein